MTTNEANLILGLDSGADDELRLNAFNAKKDFFTQKLETAATEGLKKKYAQALAKCEEAYELLELAEIDGESLLFSEDLDKSESSRAPETEAVEVELVDSINRQPTAQSRAVMKREPDALERQPANHRKSRSFSFLIVLILLAAAGAGGWYFVNEQGFKNTRKWLSEIREFPLDSEKREFESFKASALDFITSTSQRYQISLSDALDDLTTKYEEKRRQRELELETRFRIVAASIQQNNERLQSAEEKLNDLQSEPGVYSGTVAAEWREARIKQWEVYLEWLQSFKLESGAATYYEEGFKFFTDDLFNKATEKLILAEGEIQKIETEIGSGKRLRYYGPLVELVLEHRDWIPFVNSESDVLVDLVSESLAQQLEYLLKGGDLRQATYADLQDLLKLTGPDDPDYIEFAGELALRGWFKNPHAQHRSLAFHIQQALDRGNAESVVERLKELHDYYPKTEHLLEFSNRAVSAFFNFGKTAFGGIDKLASETFLALALAGNLLSKEDSGEAEYLLGMLKRERQSIKEAIEHFKNSAEFGNSRASLLYGLHLVSKKQSGAAIYIKSAIEKGALNDMKLSANETYLLGLYYEKFATNWNKANQYYQMAANNGSASAFSRLAEYERQRQNSIIAGYESQISDLERQVSRIEAQKRTANDRIYSYKSKYTNAGLYYDVNEYIDAKNGEIAKVQSQINQIHENFNQRSNSGGTIASGYASGAFGNADPDLVAGIAAAENLAQGIADISNKNALYRQLSQLKNELGQARSAQNNIKSLEREIVNHDMSIRRLNGEISSIRNQIQNFRQER